MVDALLRVMTIKEHIQYVETLLASAVKHDDWDAATRFTFVLCILRQDLIIEQERLINNLRRVS